jgi:type II secretory pathway pseudopilin PulG
MEGRVVVGIILLIILAVLIALMVVLYFLGRKAQKKKEEQDEQIKAAAQTISMLIIDKKKMRMKDAGLPAQIMEQTPKLMRRSKLPIVKAKVGPRVMTLIADEQIFDDIPVKKEVKATVSGLYITGVRGLRGPLEKAPAKKKGFRAKLQSKYNELNAQLKEEDSQPEKKGKKKK